MNKKMSFFILIFSFICISPQLHATSETTEKPIRVYVDMVADLFHAGHVNFLKQAHAHGDYLIVGLHSDEVCTDYKRKPILTLEERIASVSACRYVDEVISHAPLVVTDEYLDKHKIDVVIHGDDFDEEIIRRFYGAPIDRGIFKTVPYTEGISTSEILRRILSRKSEELFSK